ncbi:hypothetical protein ACFYNO_02905 [Kitasatospora sp. NPDC006697]|uniref:hypothetical protein n=1 Tax=Kitasatospora sp. NPDC006697 TaxID=3364020 RepID=UPI0036AF6408
MQPSHSPVQPSSESEPDGLAELLDSSRRLGLFWPPLERGTRPGAPSRPITVPDRTRALVAGMAEFGG